MELFNITNITEIINKHSPFGVFMIVMLEYANIPLPSELVLPLVGILVAKGSLVEKNLSNNWIKKYEYLRR